VYNLQALILLHNTEQQIIQKTEETVQGACEIMPLVINQLIWLPQFICNNNKDIHTDNPRIHFCVQQFWNLPYSLYTAWELICKGHYSDAYALIRGVLEGFLQMKYFLNIDGDADKRFQEHMYGSYNERISFFKMFKHLVPDISTLGYIEGDNECIISKENSFYSFWYGKILSGCSHKGLTSALFRMGYSEDGKINPSRLVPGNQFNKSALCTSLGLLICLAYGLFTLAMKAFPNNNLIDKSGNIIDIPTSKVLSWIHKWKEGQEEFPKETDFFWKYIFELVGF